MVGAGVEESRTEMMEGKSIPTAPCGSLMVVEIVRKVKNVLYSEESLLESVCCCKRLVEIKNNYRFGISSVPTFTRYERFFSLSSNRSLLANGQSSPELYLKMVIRLKGLQWIWMKARKGYLRTCERKSEEARFYVSI
jgi:hypothetical protein